MKRNAGKFKNRERETISTYLRNKIGFSNFKKMGRMVNCRLNNDVEKVKHGNGSTAFYSTDDSEGVLNLKENEIPEDETMTFLVNIFRS